MPIRYGTNTPVETEPIPVDPRTLPGPATLPVETEPIPVDPRTLPGPATLPETNGFIPFPHRPPDPPPADVLETMVLLVDKCLSRTARDERLKRVLAGWLEERTGRAASWWIRQWGLA